MQIISRIILIASTFASMSVMAISNTEKSVGIASGEYVLEKGSSEECLSGDLTYLAVDDFVGVKLGAHLLVQGANKTSFELSERDCKFSYKNKVSQGSVSSRIRQNCKDSGLTEREVKLSKTDKGFLYTVNVVSGKNKEVKLTQKCTLTATSSSATKK
jgi:hypothetical protein